MRDDIVADSLWSDEEEREHGRCPSNIQHEPNVEVHSAASAISE